ncbi:MAG: hypothetical protein NTY80_00490 [candidate division SR1 bacterium]|nr:hypothetical protein [candidate division SR1 bacterium]
MNKNNESKEGTPTTGFFVALGEETDSLKKNNTISEGRLGIFHKKPELIATLAKNPAMHGTNVHIIEVAVPKASVIGSNAEKFGFIRGHEVPIISITPHIHSATEVALA